MWLYCSQSGWKLKDKTVRNNPVSDVHFDSFRTVDEQLSHWDIIFTRTLDVDRVLTVKTWRYPDRRSRDDTYERILVALEAQEI